MIVQTEKFKEMFKDPIEFSAWIYWKWTSFIGDHSEGQTEKKLIGSYNLIKIFLASLNQSISFLTNNLFRKIAAIENGSIQKMIKRPLLLANGSSRLESFHSLNHYLHMGNFLFLGENFQNNLLGRSLINCLCFQNSFSSLSFV